MLNPFPIQFLSLFAYFILRFFVGTILIYLGFKHYRNRDTLKETLILSWCKHGASATWFLILGEIIIGSLLVLGAYVQYAALALIVMCIEMLIIRNWFSHPNIPPKIFYLLLLACSLSLFITGAGVLAFDLPI